MDVRVPSLQNNGGIHIESMYMILDRSNFVEFLWYVEQPGFFMGPESVSDARRYDGVYDRRATPFEENVSDTTHRFYMRHDPATDYYRFHLDDRAAYSQYREPPFRFASPIFFGEIGYECDDGATHFKEMEYRTRADDGTRNAWSGTRWTCDFEEHYGYTWISDNEIRYDTREGRDEFSQHNYAKTCDPVDGALGDDEGVYSGQSIPSVDPPEGVPPIPPLPGQ